MTSKRASRSANKTPKGGLSERGGVKASAAAGPAQAAEVRPKLRMAELVEATGVSKSTILYYVAEGLIPQPERPKPNVALYDPVSIDVIRYIRSAQEIHRYPLAWIRVNIPFILKGAPPEDLLHLGERIMGTPTKMSRLDEVAQALAVAEQDIKRFVDLGLVWPTQEGEFDEYDVRLVEALARAEEVGLPAEAFTGVAEAVKEVEEAAADIASRFITQPMATARASVLVDVLGRLQPYLLHRYVENRQL